MPYQLPVLTWLSTLFALHVCTQRVKKTGRKKRKRGCSPKDGRSCCMPSGQTKGLQTCRGNKAKLPLFLPAVVVMEIANLWKTVTWTACGCFGYYQITFDLERKHLWVLFCGLQLKTCQLFVKAELKFFKKPLLQNFKTKTRQCFQNRQLWGREGLC